MKVSTPVNRLKGSVIKSTAVLLALTTILGGTPELSKAVGLSPMKVYANSASTSDTVTIDGYTYSKDAKESLDYVNEVRKQLGLQPVILNPYLTKMAEDHANYLMVNNTTGHVQEKGKKGFTGETSRDRFRGVYSGVSHGLNGYAEGIYYAKTTMLEGVKGLISIPYHRVPYIHPATTNIGVADNKRATVAVKGYNYGFTSNDFVVYPFANEREVNPRHMPESPNPLDGTGLTESGLILSYLTTSTNEPKISLKDSKGGAVDGILKRDETRGNPTDAFGYSHYMFIPKTVLKENETYTATANDYTWSFTTGKDPRAKTEEPKPEEKPKEKPPIVDEKAPRLFTKDDVGVRLDGKYINLNPTAKVINGSTLIPLRGVFEKMGAHVFWSPASDFRVRGSDGKLKTPDFTSVVTIKSDKTIEIYIGTNRATIDGSSVTLPSKISTINGTTYVPLRFVSEALGAKVSWEPDNYTAVILTP